MSANAITLYIYPGSSSLIPHILLRYAGIDFTPQLGVPADPAFAAINPKKQVPAFSLNGEIITENIAIVHAVNQLAPDKQIMGRDDLELLRQCEWLSWVFTSLHAQAWGPYVRPWRFTSDETGVDAVKQAAETRLLNLFDRIEDRLDGRGPWTMGDHFTAIDAFLFHRYRTARTRMKLENMGAKYPKWTKIHDQVGALEASKKALEIEDEMRTYAPPFS